MSANIPGRSTEHLITNEDALFLLIFDLRLQILENGLENVGRNKSIEEHELEFQSLDKKIQEILLDAHHDKDSFENLHAIMGVIRNIFDIMNKLNINLGHYRSILATSGQENADEISARVLEVASTISSILEMKHRKIIPQIYHFLTDAKNCVKAFFENKIDEFHRYQNMTQFHLNKCIEGHEELLAQIDVAKGRCTDKKNNYICVLLENMRNETSANIENLKSTKEFTRCPVNDFYKSFSKYEHVEDYCVLPFAVYSRVILLCHAVLTYTNKTFGKKLDYVTPAISDAHYSKAPNLEHLYDLVLQLQIRSFQSLKIKDNGEKTPTAQGVIKQFRDALQRFDTFYLNVRFRVCDYENKFKSLINMLEKYEVYKKVFLESKSNEEALKQDLTKLKNCNTQLNVCLAKFKDHNAKLSDENSKLKNDIKKLSDGNTKLNLENTKLKAQNLELEEDNAKLIDENSKLNFNNKMLNDDNAKLNNDSTKQKDEILQLKNENKKLKNENEKLNDDNTKLNNHNINQNDENSKLKKENTELKDDNTKLNNHQAELNDEMIKLYDENSKLRDDNIKLNRGCIMLNNNNEKLTGYITKLNNDNAKLENDNKIFTSRIEELEQKYEEVMKQIQEFHRKEEEWSEQRKLQSQNKSATLQNVHLQTL